MCLFREVKAYEPNEYIYLASSDRTKEFSNGRVGQESMGGRGNRGKLRREEGKRSGAGAWKRVGDWRSFKAKENGGTVEGTFKTKKFGDQQWWSQDKNVVGAHKH